MKGINKIKLSKEDQETALHLLWIHLRESESKLNQYDAVLKRQISQTYDFLNRIELTNARPEFEKKQ